MPCAFCRQSGHNIRTCRRYVEIREGRERGIRGIFNSLLVFFQGIKERLIISESQGKDKKLIKCPLCRQYSIVYIENVNEIEEECCVCWENKANILLDKCGHRCLCKECVIKM